MTLSYKYIIFNSADYKDGRNDNDGYYTICLNDLRNIPDIDIVGGPMPIMPKAVNLAIRVLNKLNIPFSLLRPFIRSKRSNAKPVCVLLFRMFDVVYLKWLRLQYPQTKFVLFLRDLYETKQPLVSFYKKDNLIDVWGTYDENEFVKYNMDFYYPEIESKLDFSHLDITPKVDVFFAGAAKNRYQKLLKAYDYLTSFGIRCHFIIMDVNDKEKENRDGIEYTRDLIPYKDMLIYSLQCKCMLEINQENAVGNTSRLLEAIMYNKKLITNNKSVINNQFYNPNYIRIFDDISEIEPDFVLKDIIVDFGYNNEFSPTGLIQKVEELLIS